MPVKLKKKLCPQKILLYAVNSCKKSEKFHSLILYKTWKMLGLFQAPLDSKNLKQDFSKKKKHPFILVQLFAKSQKSFVSIFHKTWRISFLASLAWKPRKIFKQIKIFSKKNIRIYVAVTSCEREVILIFIKLKKLHFRPILDSFRTKNVNMKHFPKKWYKSNLILYATLNSWKQIQKNPKH